MQTITDILIAAGHIGRALAPAGLGDAAALLAIGLTLHAPLLAGFALALRWTR